MSFEKLIADYTEALKANTVAIIELQKVLAGQKGATNVTTVSTKSDEGKSNAGGADETTLYWSVPNTEHFGTVKSEAEFKKIKKDHPKAIKIPESKYEALVEAASKSDDTGEYSERILALIEALSETPEESDIIELFTGYLPKDLSKDERAARAEIIKPILEGVKAAKATAVKEEDRYEVMVAVIKGIESHLEETGQVSEDDEGGLV